MKQISLIKLLVLFNVIIMSGYTDSIVSKQLRTFVTENRLAQHIIAIITMAILITTSVTDDIQTVIVYTIIGYVLFLLTTKLDLHWNIAILIILFFGYMFEMNRTSRQERINNDKNLSPEKKQKLINKYGKINMIFLISVIGLTVAGTIFYTHKKIAQYGSDYDIVKYIIG